MPTSRPPGPATAEAWQTAAEALRRYALALTGDPHAAEDLAQQTLARLLAREPAKAMHAGYARRTLTRLWLDDRRSLRRRVLRLGRVARAARPAHEDGDALERREELALARRAIDGLAPAQRAALVLRLVEGLGYPEIAAELGCSVSAARSHLHAARAALRRRQETPR